MTASEQLDAVGTAQPSPDVDWWPWSESAEDAPAAAPRAYGRGLMVAIYALLALFAGSLVVWGVVLVVAG